VSPGAILTTSHRLILYITLDPESHRGPDGGPGAHATNYNNLSRIARDWRPDATLDHAWCAALTPAALEDPRLLALVMAGSFTDWVGAVRQPAWQRLLDEYAGLIRQTRVPTLAICGSHQFVAYMYGGWNAVGHMACDGAVPVRATQEADGILRAPSPRVGEVGVYAFCAAARARDPILRGMPERMHFVEYHHDEAYLDALPPNIHSLLRPDGIDDAVQLAPYDMGRAVVVPGQSPTPFAHRPVATAAERCQAQLLRCDVPPAGRVFYSAQLHPELTWDTPDLAAQAANREGPLLIHNFLDLADSYWRDAA
jgi:GMP synthase-like glutamine amidotransferase